MFILTACGITSQESMDIDNNFKGERIIKLVIDSETYNRANGGKEAVLRFLNENDVVLLELNYIKEEQDYIEIEYAIKFDSKDDYINKLKTLYQLGNIEEEISLDFQVVNNGFGKVVEFYGNSDVKKIFSFFINKASDEGLIYKEDISSIWSTKQYPLTINDTEYVKNSTSNYGSYSENLYIGPRSVNILTSKSDGDNKYNRIIVLFFDEENYSKLDNSWETGFILNEKTKVEKNDKNRSVSFIYEKFSQDEINTETSKFFGVGSNFSMSYTNSGEKLKTKETLKDLLPQSELSSKSNINYLYYFDQKDVSELPTNDDISQYKSNERIVYFSRWDLNNGISKTIETNIVFDKIQIQTKFNENNF